MEATTRNKGRCTAPRHYAARDLVTQILESVARAVGVYAAWGYGVADPEASAHLIDRHMGEATRLANAGLRLLGSHCGGGSDGRADLAISNMAGLRDVMVRDIRSGPTFQEGLGAEASDYFRALLLPMTVDLPPEQALPPWTLDRTNGLVIDESPTCRVGLQGDEGDNLRAVVAGVEIDPPLTPRMYRLIARLIEAGPSGLTRDQLGGDRPAVSELRAYGAWKGIIKAPGKRGPSKCPGRYLVESA